MKLLGQGAEACLYETNYLGKKCLLKKRIPKKYRNKELDERIRRERTVLEASLLHKAKELGVRAPIVYKVDKKECSIAMEFIEGKRAKDSLNEKNLWICRQAGRLAGRLHKAGIIHGDLTTSNIIVSGKGIAFVDFGLGFFSQKLEDRAVDLVGFKKTFHATHFSLKEGWKQVLKGYLEEFPEKQVLEQMEQIEKRARYS